MQFCLLFSLLISNALAAPEPPVARVCASGANLILDPDWAHLPRAEVIVADRAPAASADAAPREPRSAPPPSRFARPVEFSVTIAIRGGHVPAGWLDTLKLWCSVRCDKALASLERGKEEHLHIQAVFVIMIEGAVTTQMINNYRNPIKNALGIRRGDGSRATMQIKTFSAGQSFLPMVRCRCLPPPSPSALHTPFLLCTPLRRGLPTLFCS